MGRQFRGAKSLAQPVSSQAPALATSQPRPQTRPTQQATPGSSPYMVWSRPVHSDHAHVRSGQGQVASISPKTTPSHLATPTGHAPNSVCSDHAHNQAVKWPRP